MKTRSLTQEQLKEVLIYDPELGEFRWKQSSGRWKKFPPLSIAGTVSKIHGYREIRVLGVFQKAHRLAWLYMTGEWPKNEIDHINRIRSDNRWCNLRQATTQENLKNKVTYKNNKSGTSGVSWRADNKKWWARISVVKDGKDRRISLGCFGKKEDAIAKRKEAEKIYYPNKV